MRISFFRKELGNCYLLNVVIYKGLSYLQVYPFLDNMDFTSNMYDELDIRSVICTFHQLIELISFVM